MKEDFPQLRGWQAPTAIWSQRVGFGGGLRRREGVREEMARHGQCARISQCYLGVPPKSFLSFFVALLGVCGKAAWALIVPEGSSTLGGVLLTADMDSRKFYSCFAL